MKAIIAMRKTSIRVGLAFTVLFVGAACSKASQEAGPGASASEKGGHDHHAHHDEPCEEDRGSRLLFPTATMTKDQNGQTVEHYGPSFAIDGRTTVADIRSAPGKHMETTVHMEGFVSAGCKRRRAWFAIVDDQRSGNPLRVLTTPSFRAPLDAIGKRVRVEGKVTTIRVPADSARHMAEEHTLPMPKETTGEISETVVEATSAEFY